MSQQLVIVRLKGQWVPPYQAGQLFSVSGYRMAMMVRRGWVEFWDLSKNHPDLMVREWPKGASHA
uniref:Uncharacterized protein n=1 Tax=viral metagenome TaxID=1070528 RepID=A0A6M3XZD8_9ZZZZ